MKAGLHLKRPCLLVADLERALQLYRDILGFQVDYISAASPDSYLYPVFGLPPEAQLTFAALSTVHEIRAIAITEVTGVILPPPAVPHPVGLVIQVSDLATVITSVQALGLTVIAANTFEAPPNRVFTEQGMHDFDGHLLILYEVRTTSPGTSTVEV